jgi:hypothetical protein
MLPRSCRWSDVASGPGGHPTASGITDAPLEIRGRANLVGQLDAALPLSIAIDESREARACRPAPADGPRDITSRLDE